MITVINEHPVNCNVFLLRGGLAIIGFVQGRFADEDHAHIMFWNSDR